MSRNVIFKRAWFNCRNQLKGETAEEYITALYKLAVNCDYRALKLEMIRDQLVGGIWDTSLSERLQMDAELMLEKAKKVVRQREAVHDQQKVLKEVGEPSIFEAVHLHFEHRCGLQNQHSKAEREQSKGRSQTLTPSCAHVVAKGSMHLTSALLKMLPATRVSGKASMVHSATPNLLQLSRRGVKARLKVLSWILSPPTRKLQGFQTSRWAQRPSSSSWTQVQK